MSSIPNNDAIVRVREAAVKVCLIRALNEALPSKANGRRLKAWQQLSHTAQLLAAEMYLVKKNTLADVVTRLKEIGEPIDQSSLHRWLKRVDASYRVELNKAASQDPATADIDVHAGDLVAQLGVIWSKANTMLARYMSDAEWADLDKDSRNNVMRFLEGATDAAKVQAQARQHEATTERILLQVKAAAAAGASKSKGATQVTFQQICATIDQAIGIRPAGGGA
jgi:transposase